MPRSATPWTYYNDARTHRDIAQSERNYGRYDNRKFDLVDQLIGLPAMMWTACKPSLELQRAFLTDMPLIRSGQRYVVQGQQQLLDQLASSAEDAITGSDVLARIEHGLRS